MTRRPNQDARARILRIAHELFSQGGFEAISMDRVAASVGIKKANLFHYYPTKQALGMAVVEEAARQNIHGMREIFGDSSRDPVEAVRRLFARNVVQEKNDCPRGCFIGRMAQDIGAERVDMRQRVASCVGEWRLDMARFLALWKKRGYFRGDLRPEEAADAVLSLYEGGLLIAMAIGSPEPARNAQRAAITLLVAWKEEQ